MSAVNLSPAGARLGLILSFPLEVTGIVDAEERRSLFEARFRPAVCVLGLEAARVAAARGVAHVARNEAWLESLERNSPALVSLARGCSEDAEKACQSLLKLWCAGFLPGRCGGQEDRGERLRSC